MPHHLVSAFGRLVKYEKRWGKWGAFDEFNQRLAVDGGACLRHRVSLCALVSFKSRKTAFANFPTDALNKPTCDDRNRCGGKSETCDLCDSFDCPPQLTLMHVWERLFELCIFSLVRGLSVSVPVQSAAAHKATITPLPKNPLATCTSSALQKGPQAGRGLPVSIKYVSLSLFVDSWEYQQV